MKCGFSKFDVTPPLGCHLMGYPTERIADAVLDPLYVRCAAFQEEGTAIFLCFDLLGIPQVENRKIREYVAEYVGCEPKDVFVSCTHTHTGPNIYSDYYEKDTTYINELKHFAARAAEIALSDLKEAAFCYAKSEVHEVSFVRRYRMKDGSVRTNPGVRNPDILEPMNPGDDTLQLLKVIREDGSEVLVVNYQVHPDTVGGTGICADYPAVVCNALEGALPNTHCLYLNGTAGDLNHINVHAPVGDIYKGVKMAQHMGLKIAGEVLAIYTKAQPIATGTVRTVEQIIPIALKRPTQEELERSQEIMRLHWAGELEPLLKDKVGMERTTFLMEAKNIVDVYQEGPERPMYVNGASLGDICLVGIPGEPFCEVGKQIRAKSPFAVQFVMGQTNGMEGYFPTEDAFSVNGYESRTSKFKPGVAETLIAAGQAATQALFVASEK